MGGSSKKQTIGYKYYLGLHHIICVARKGIRLRRIIAGEREVWAGDLNANQQLYLNKPDLFGGEQKEGGIRGHVDVEFGSNTQGQNSYLKQHLGDLLPGYRGLLGVVLRKCYITAMNPYMKPWWYLVTSCPQHWYPEKADINGGSANGAHIIHEILTQPAPLGQGISVHRLNEASFRKFADTLYREGLGLSMKLSRPDELDSFIGIVCDHVDAIFYEDPFTGLLSVKALRDDYNSSNLIVLNADNSDLVGYERPSMGETVNTLTLTFRPRGQPNDDTVTVHNLASISKQGVVPQGINLPGIDSAFNANKLALSRLRKMSANVTKFTIRNIDPDVMKRFTIGDCVAVEFPSDDVKRVIVRVMKITVPKTNGDGWTIEGLEDIFSISESSFIGEQEPEWEDPIKPPQPLTDVLPFETPYWTIVRNLPQVIVDTITDTDCFAAVALPHATFPSPSSDVYTKLSTQPQFQYQFTGTYCPFAKVDENYDQLATAIKFIDSRGRINEVVVGTYAIIVSGTDIEYVRVDGINQANSTLTCGRGVLDSVPIRIAKGSQILFAEQFTTYDDDKFLPNETLGIKVCPRTGSGILDLAAAPTNSLVMKGRQGKPYPPANVKINDIYWPDQLTGKLVITWTSRNKKTQTANLINWYSGAISPEPNTTYNVKVYDDGKLVHEKSGIIDTTYSFIPTKTVTTGDTTIKVSVSTTVDSKISNPVDVEFTYSHTGFNRAFNKYFNGV